jgi:class 3 adenylate cyclase
MHRQLKSLLPGAKGESHLVVAIFLDIRGFSSFAKIAESAEAALFLRSMYVRILDDYFPTASFFKPTGDGLMIIFHYDADNLQETVNNSISSSIRLVKDFPTLTSGDPVINFEVPEALGIGLARGAATALVSGEQTLDYSGRPLNLAARLMDLARPKGVVFTGNLGYELLEKIYTKQFKKDKVYVKGIADDTPIEVYVLDKMVKLPDSSKRPLTRYSWKNTSPEKVTFKTIKQRGPRYLTLLPVEPALTADIRVHVRHPALTASGRKHPKLWTMRQFKADYEHKPGRDYAAINYAQIISGLEEDGVKDSWPVETTIEYATYPDD